jgi:site-specific DNA-methyltransferase (adenine-specific)
MSISETYNEDCMAVMARYPDKYFDLAVVDPPYGIGIDGQKQSVNKNPKHNRKYHEKKGWDKFAPESDYFNLLFRKTKNQIIWGANYFVEHLHKPTKGWVIWYKGQQGLTMSDAELAYSSLDCPTRVILINRVQLLKEGTIHPTQKPIALYDWIFKNYAKAGDKILDTHLGSGSSRIAADRAGLDFVGCELDADYFAAQEKRFSQYKMQLKLL